ncbi:Fic family protein [Pseudodesulfovibrio alkaliphilus]|nr:Fic family protein [Pseudodesulfovibrio alkaliphilus]
MASKFDGDSRVEVVTLTRGDRFHFSRRYDDDAIAQVMDSIKSIHENLCMLPAGDAVLVEIQKLERRGLWGTVVIEGNPLSEAEAQSVLARPEDSPERSQAEQELLNARRAYAALDAMQLDNPDGSLISEAMIKEFHRILTEGIAHKYNVPGKYRELRQFPSVHDIKVGSRETGGIYKPPKLKEDIETLMGRLVQWINSSELLAVDPIVRAALAHYHLALIHPFWDGNGRTARLLEAYLLHKSGIRYAPMMISRYYNQFHKRYYEAYRICQKDGDKIVNAFLDVFLACFGASIAEVLKMVVSDYERVVFKEKTESLFKKRRINKRQLNVALAMQKTGGVMTVRSMKEEFPFNVVYDQLSVHTVRRDLDRLATESLLVKGESGYKPFRSVQGKSIDSVYAAFLGVGEGLLTHTGASVTVDESGGELTFG